jgi:hypothetical protein
MIVTLTGSHNSGCISEKVKLHTALLLLQEVFATKYLSVLPIFLHANISVEGTRFYPLLFLNLSRIMMSRFI